MIAALISGKIYGQPTEREARNGNVYLTFKVRAPCRDNTSQFVSIMCFETAVIDILRNMSEGDPIALIGELSASAYSNKNGEPQPSLQLIATQALSVHQVKRRRAASSDKPTQQNESAGGRSTGRDPELDDDVSDIPF